MLNGYLSGIICVAVMFSPSLLTCCGLAKVLGYIGSLIHRPTILPSWMTGLCVNESH